MTRRPPSSTLLPYTPFSASSGLGIPPAEQRRIFEKFYRLDPQMTRGIGGTGLGLYICRELVRRVDGKIWVESTAGRSEEHTSELQSQSNLVCRLLLE